jgi:nitroimidazol reductase NimA-like FMN-containing flavoprotein (pyridoxamine 5'-phosphate oxidase superfamily)
MPDRGALVNSAGLEILSREECLGLLASVRIGRIVFTDRALPAVQPVVFAVHAGGIVLRLPEGSTALAATDAIVAFEADNVAHDLREGWTVTVIGHAEDVRDPERLNQFAALRLPTLSRGAADRYLLIAVEVVSGTRIPMPRQQTAL